MRHSPLLIAAASTMALLAACGRNEPAADAASLSAKAAELQQKEAELAQREAALAAQGAPTTPAPMAEAPSQPTVTASTATAEMKPVAVKPAAKPTSSTAAPKPAAAPRVVTVPAGTALPLALAGALSTKTAKVGDVVRATVTEDVMVDGRVAIARGTTVAGQLVKVISGSDKIGGVPTLGMSFERLELAGGKDVPLAGEITQSGKSDTGRDTAKIVGGAAAGAIIGSQVKKGDKGKVLGGLLGGAVGAVAAQKTGTEVELAEGTALNLTLSAPVEITK